MASTSTNTQGIFSIDITPPEDNTKKVLKISVPGYESITINPFKGNGELKENLGIIYLTPKNKSLEKEKIKISRTSKEQIESLNSDKKDLKYYAQERLNKQVENLKTTLLPMILNMIAQFGITKASELIQKSAQEIQSKLLEEKECPDETQLLALINKKNSIVKQLNTTLTIIDSTTTALGITSGVITATQIALTATENIPSIYNPTPPGVIKKLDKTLNSLNANSKALSSILIVLKQLLKQIVDLLSILDTLTGQCAFDSPAVTAALPDRLLELTQQQSQQQSPVVTNVNGFEMGIETESTLNPLKRKRAIAKNKQNIVMLKGEWSYSSIDQILIDELIFYIQQNNLKAD